MNSEPSFEEVNSLAELVTQVEIETTSSNDEDKSKRCFDYVKNAQGFVISMTIIHIRLGKCFGSSVYSFLSKCST